MIPKSVTPARITENWEGVRGWRLTDQQAAAIDALGDAQLKFAWDPSKVA